MEIFINNNFVNINKKIIGANDRGFLLGDGIFTTIKAINSELKYFDNHMARLFRHASMIYINIPMSIDEIKNNCIELLKRNNLENNIALIRITITRGESERGINIPKKNKPTILIKTTPYIENLNELPKLCFTSIVRNDLSILTKIKSLNFLEQILAKKEAQEKGFDDGIMLNTRNAICESSTANLFFVTSNYEVLTPHLSEGVLDGIIRSNVINACKKLNIPILQRSIKPEDIYDCIEAFQTNCAIEIQNIMSIEDMEFKYNNDSVTQLIREYCKT